MDRPFCCRNSECSARRWRRAYNVVGEGAACACHSSAAGKWRPLLLSRGRHSPAAPPRPRRAPRPRRRPPARAPPRADGARAPSSAVVCRRRRRRCRRLCPRLSPRPPPQPSRSQRCQARSPRTARVRNAAASPVPPAPPSPASLFRRPSRSRQSSRTYRAFGRLGDTDALFRCRPKLRGG